MQRVIGPFVLAALVIGLVACAPPPAAPPKESTKQAPAAPAAKAPAAGVDKAKQEAEARGYKFVANHDEILEKAKQEGVLKVATSADPASMKVIKEQYSAKYPFIKFEILEVSGTDQHQRFILEMQAGAAADFDVLSIADEFLADYDPYTEKYDLLGMAQQGVLKDVPEGMVYPDGRNMISLAVQVGIVAYNKKLVPEAQVPKVWEDLLKPEFKGRKMITDIRPNTLAALAPAKGEEWLKDFATKLAAQETVWARGNTRAQAALAAGEYAVHSATYYAGTMRSISRGASDLAVAIVEPVPLSLTHIEGVQKGAKHPNAALLYLEWRSGPEGQKIMEEVEPLKASIYSPGSTTGKIVEGKQLSVLSWKQLPEQGRIQEMITKAYGLPKAEISG
jgi:iron(III) transport system substrate-binding protein